MVEGFCCSKPLCMVVIPLLMIAGDVETNPVPEGNYCNIAINNTVWVFRTCMEIDFGCHINQVLTASIIIQCIL